MRTNHIVNLGFGVLLLMLITFTRVISAAPIEYPTLIPQSPALSASSYILMDFNSQRILAYRNINEKLAPASLTKMMTMYVIDCEIQKDKLTLNTLIPVSKKAWSAEGSRMFIEVNKQIPVQELIKGIIISSGNDASIAMAEHIAGSEEAFSELMNYYAKKLGMTSSHFINATGLPHPEHYSTTKDLSILARALIRDFPQSYALYSKKTFTFNKIEQPNRNRLLWRNDHVDGIKTGHTDSAGYCLAASGKKNNMRLISIIMHTKNDNIRTNESNTLLSWGFRFFETHKLYPPKVPIQTVRVWMGTEKTLDLGTIEPVYITIAQGQFKKMQKTIKIPSIIKAPTKKGDELGTLLLKSQDKTILEQPLIALKDIPKGNIFSRIYDYIALKILLLEQKILFSKPA